MPTDSSSTITLASFQTILARYDKVLNVVSQSKTSKSSFIGQKSLVELDKWKDTLITTVIQRKDKVDKNNENSISGASMTKDELLDILRWKLKHGKNRPTLPSLVESNSAQDVKTVTLDAFSIPPSEVKSSLTKLIVLRGIGPATATAVLSTVYPETVPFFSDEAFRWVVHNGDWTKKIDYTMKEYLIFYNNTKEIMERLEGETTAKDVERVGWILGQEAALGLKHDRDDLQVVDHAEVDGVSNPQKSKSSSHKKGNITVEKETKSTEKSKVHDNITGKEPSDVRRSKRLKTGQA